MLRRKAENFISALKTMRNGATDNQAVNAVWAYAEWRPDTEYEADDRRRSGDKLYKCRQAHTSQEIYPPETIPALWVEISLEDGTREHPISYNNNMELNEGKYYKQDDVVYICTRSTGVPVYNDLADLVGIYVEAAQ